MTESTSAPFCSGARGFFHYSESTRVFQLICQVEHFTLVYYTTGPKLLVTDATDAILGEEDQGEATATVTASETTVSPGESATGFQSM